MINLKTIYLNSTVWEEADCCSIDHTPNTYQYTKRHYSVTSWSFLWQKICTGFRPDIFHRRTCVCPLVSAGHKLWPDTKSLQCPVSELSTAVLSLAATYTLYKPVLSTTSYPKSLPALQTFILQLQTTITQWHADLSLTKRSHHRKKINSLLTFIYTIYIYMIILNNWLYFFLNFILSNFCKPICALQNLFRPNWLMWGILSVDRNIRCFN